MSARTRLRQFAHRHPKRFAAIIGSAFCLWLISRLFTGSSTDMIDSYNACANAGYPVTDTNPPLCDVGSHTILGPVKPTPTPGPVYASQPFQLLVTGNSSGTYPATNQLITTEIDWQHYWSTVHSGLKQLPPILPVNFNLNDVVAVTLGIEQTTGYTLTVGSITSSPTAGSYVSVAESVPSIGCPVSNTPTDPYVMVSTAKLSTPVKFQVTISHRRCGD